MISFIKKHAIVLTSIALLPFLYSPVTAGPVSTQQAQKVADTFLKARIAPTPKGFRLLSVKSQLTPAGIREIRNDDGSALAYITELEPRGFIATSADTDIAPIVAYSSRTSFPADNDMKNPLYRMLKADMKLRTDALAEYKQPNTAKNRELWNLYAGNNVSDVAVENFSQWPVENTTPTGGWLETMWDQAEPYNIFCPLDPVDAKRSYVGCVATAMAQLINYHKTFSIRFKEDDSYSTYYGIDFDKDSELYDFPSFEELNELIAGVYAKYENNIDINDMDAAIISFACGIAIQMDYSSEGSGASPYDLRQALVDKFGYYSADMTGGLSGEVYQILQENMINQLPALLSISPPDGWGGHVVVCDGYNTDGAYHLNFGWGPEHPNDITEVWYYLPGNLITGLSIISEALLNVQPFEPEIIVEPSFLSFRAAPGLESPRKEISIESPGANTKINSISCTEGFTFAKWAGTYSDYMESFELNEPETSTTIYVKFMPDEARGYYGTLEIDYSDGKKKYVILKGYSYTGGTEITANTVSGTWTQDESPYYVFYDIAVERNSELVIEPGVQVFFMGPYGMNIGERARLAAEGTANNPIVFTAWNKDVGWTGLRFLESGDDDILSHCIISYSKKNSGFITEYDTSADLNTCGGAVYCYMSDLTITNCKITNNTGDKGGAVYCDESDLQISNTVIANNSSLGGSPQCGGICTGQSGAPEILNCTIVNNVPGGIFTQSWEGIDLINTIVWGNDRYQIQKVESAPRISFCNIQDGYDGQGNMDADPSFFDPTLGVGAQYDGSAANWTLQSNSPCINSGRRINFSNTDLAGNPRINSAIIDIGAYENQSDLPLITIAPSVTCDAGPVNLNSDSSIFIEIVNTGMIDFNIESLNIPDVNSAFSLITSVYNQPLTPGDSVEVEIGFYPKDEKIFTDTLEIHSTCSNAPVKSVYLKGVGVTGTVITEGQVSGSWVKANSPYTVTGDIEVANGKTLTIEPGVVVKFAGHYKFTVGYRATLNATGTEEENIIFTATDTDEGWFGLRLINSGNDDTLEYCKLEYSKKSRYGEGGYENFMGGAIICLGSWDAEPGYPVPSNAIIDHCLLTNNQAEYGGGIMLFYSDAVITNNCIMENSADAVGGGIYNFASGGKIVNNVIAYNSSDIVGGGILNMYGNSSIINNTIVHNRPSGLHLDGTGLDMWDPDYGRPVLNNIIWQNELYIEEYVAENEYDIRFNDIQGGWDGDGNINVDPLFADAENRDYHLKSEAGRWDPLNMSWVVDESTSPCIDAGNPGNSAGDEPVDNGNRINMGAYGGTPEASKSL